MTNTNQPAPAGQTHFAYTDGACHGNPGAGAWAYRLESPDGTFTEAAGFLQKTTNNKAELLAVINALDMTAPGSRVHILSDAQYVTYGATTWLPNWKAKGWVNAKKKPVKNRELWEMLDELMAAREVTFEHVKGHSGVPGNERAHEIATDATELRSDFAPMTRPSNPL